MTTLFKLLVVFNFVCYEMILQKLTYTTEQYVSYGILGIPWTTRTGNQLFKWKISRNCYKYIECRQCKDFFKFFLLNNLINGMSGVASPTTVFPKLL